jgi:hypothetical protein
MPSRIFGRAAQPEPELTEAEPIAGMPDDLAAEAKRLRADAAEARGRAERGNAEADALIAAGDAEAERIKAAARQNALAAKAEATAAIREDARLGEQAKLITAAIAEQGQGAEALQRAAELGAERSGLLAELDDLDGKLAARGAERERAETELAAAEAAADISGTGKAAGTLAAADRVLASLTKQRQRAAERLQEVGDGSADTGEFGDACSAASGHHAKATELLDMVYPDTPAAVHRRLLADLHGAIEGNRQRIAEEATAKPQPRQIVHL